MSRASRALLGAAVVLALAGTTAQAHAQSQTQSRPGKSPTQPVSTAADGSQADGSSSGAAISADGRHVAFVSVAGAVTKIDLGSGHTYGSPTPSADGSRVHLLELTTGKRQLVSVDRWGGRNDLPAGHPSVLVEGDTNGVTDVFLRTVQ
ncbi:hypothetical protein ACGFXB_18985 [Streptomyces canus]|jgi:hypothetical protein|uniref:hypothetical protein n=1 Tax=Streptomyces canus TaxID=58343 RepID=UPI0037180EC7